MFRSLHNILVKKTTLAKFTMLLSVSFMVDILSMQSRRVNENGDLEDSDISHFMFRLSILMKLLSMAGCGYYAGAYLYQQRKAENKERQNILNISNQIRISSDKIETFYKALKEFDLNSIKTLFGRLEDEEKRVLLETPIQFLGYNNILHEKKPLDILYQMTLYQVTLFKTDVENSISNHSTVHLEIEKFLKTEEKKVNEELDQAHTQGSFGGAFNSNSDPQNPFHLPYDIGKLIGFFSIPEDAKTVAQTCRLANHSANFERNKLRDKLIERFRDNQLQKKNV